MLLILVYCHNFPTSGNTHYCWKTIGIFILFYQCWYNCNNLPTLESAGIHWKIIGIFLYFNNLDTLEELENTMSSS